MSGISQKNKVACDGHLDIDWLLISLNKSTLQSNSLDLTQVPNDQGNGCDEDQQPYYEVKIYTGYPDGLVTKHINALFQPRPYYTNQICGLLRILSF
jgi:hypothetical protein